MLHYITKTVFVPLNNRDDKDKKVDMETTSFGSFLPDGRDNSAPGIIN